MLPLLALLAGCSLASDAVTRRFVLNVELMVDGVPHSGSAVWEMTTEEVYNPLGNSSPLVTRAKGEAVAIAIDGDRSIFVLRRQRHHVTTDQFGGLLWDCGIRSLAELRTVQGPCEVRSIPEIVVAQRVPDDDVPQLAALFDTRAGDMTIEIVSLTVSATESPLSASISRRYPWVSKLPDAEAPTRTMSASSLNIYLPGRYYKADFVLR